MSVKVTVLYDNHSDDCCLQEGWGFSACIEYAGAKILFDTGGDAPAFSSNASKMQFCYNDVTHLLFSHKHADHIAGFKEVIKKVDRSTALYLPRTFPWLLQRYASSHLKKVKVVRSFEEITPHIYSLVLRGGFCLYEQALVLKTPKGLGIITGCAHPGIMHILQTAKKELQTDIDFVLGGFHLAFSPPGNGLSIVKQFQSLPVQRVAPCHCSGDHLIRQFKNAYGPHFFAVGTGTQVLF